MEGSTLSSDLIVCCGFVPLPWHFVPTPQLTCNSFGPSLMLLRTWGKPCLHHPNTGCVISPRSRELLCSFCCHRRSQEVLDACTLPWTNHAGTGSAESARSSTDYLKWRLQTLLPVTPATAGDEGRLPPNLAPSWSSPSTCTHLALSSSL